MAQIPTSKKPQVFNKELDGVYGHFKTKQSFALDYLLTSIKTDRLDSLETATDVLKIESIDFEELVQRDIDYVRVQKEIVEKYLQKGEGRVIFFPPLIVTLFGIDGDRPITNYTSVERTIDQNKYLVTYDRDRFAIELPLSDDQTSHAVEYQGKTRYYYNYAATLRYNEQKVRLVVLDGQHRLMALKKLVEKGERDLVAEVELPICVFFAPGAVKSDKTQESLVDDMRELFVRINEEAKTVSGHFIWLLKDKSLAAMCVRDLADEWKRKDGGFSYLHQLEWNQREATKANQTQKPYTVTTVSIVADALEYIFTDRTGYTYSLLNLGEVEQKLKTSDVSRIASDIREDMFDLDQADVLKNQINKYVTPSLDILFREPSPYKALRKAFIDGVKLLDEKVDKGIAGAAQFKKDVLEQFRSANKLDQDSVQDLDSEFTASFASDKELQKVKFFRLNIFHQALIRAWADIFNQLRNSGQVTPKDVAKALVSALEVICFDLDVDYFSAFKPYTQQVFYKGERIIVNNTSRTGLKNLILATFANAEVVSKFCSTLALKQNGEEVFETQLRKFGREVAGDYLRIFKENKKKWLSREWKFAAGLSTADETYLKHRERATDETTEKEFDDRIEVITGRFVTQAKDVLANVLKIKPDEISVSGMTDIESDNGAES